MSTSTSHGGTASAASSARYRFGSFVYEAGTGRLLKHGHAVKLERKPLRVLAALLEEPGRIVSREDLQRRLWPEDTFVDFELGLRVAVNKLRAALDDSADSPRYIETVVGEGYRFLAAAVTVEQETPPASVTASAEPKVGGRKLHWLYAAAAAVAVAALVLGWQMRRKPQPAASNGWVLIAAFDNRTGQSVLDGTLEYALERELSSSRFVKVVPRQRVNDTLRLLREPADSRLDPGLAREICQRDGEIERVLTGKVEKVGTSYVLSVQVLDPVKGVALASFSEEDPAETQLATAVSRLAVRVREALGEAPAEIAQSRPLERVTTPSLAALQLYSRANDLMMGSRGQGTDADFMAAQNQAAGLLQEAISIEPKFAMAQVLLGYTLRSRGRPDEAVPCFRRAFELKDSVTQRERLFIEGTFYWNVAHDGARAQQAYESLLALYPDDFWTVNNLSWIYGAQPGSSTADRVMAMVVRRADLRPNDFYSNFTAWQRLAAYPNRLAEARPYRDRARMLVTPEIEAHAASSVVELDLAEFHEAFERGDMKAAMEEVPRIKARLSNRNGLLRQETVVALFYVALQLGRLREASELSDSVADPGERASLRVHLAITRHDERALQRALRDEVLYKSHLSAGVVGRLAHLHQLALAEREFRELRKLNPWMVADTYYAEGELALARGDLPLAAERLRACIDTYRQSGDGAYYIAIMDYALVLDRLGRTGDAVNPLLYLMEDDPSPLPNEGRLLMAQLYRKLGRPKDAEQMEQKIRATLAYADSDHPLLRALPIVERGGRVPQGPF